MHSGYIKLWRKSIDSGMIRNHQLWVFWTWCLMKATHKPVKITVGFQEVSLLPGQFIFGRKAASAQTGITERTIRTCLKNLEIMQNLTIKTTNKYSIISIINWDAYQCEELKTTSKTTNNRPASDQQVTTNKNEKNEKNEKNIYSADFLTFWNAYPKKSAKKDALKAWGKLNGTRPPIDKLIAAIENQKQSLQWQKENGQYIPNPATWLNRGQWEDDIKVSILPAIRQEQRPIEDDFK